VCALNGSVYGGATDLMLACDLSVGLPGVEFRMPATALGLHYYPGGCNATSHGWACRAPSVHF
jgi:enoyl-CoA hydratase/carnithine racemase